MTRVILIPCSGRKRPGGGQRYTPENSAPTLLGPNSGQSLLKARYELCRILGLALGPDLGADQDAGVEYLAAFRRYDGNLYRRAHMTEEDAAGQRGPRVLIVSALYGLLTALEPIRHYNLAMSDKLPNGQRVANWWKQRCLGSLVLEALKNLGASEVHDLLSANYRQALSPWPGPCLPFAYHGHEYRGLGSGSDYHRGEDLRRLLGDPWASGGSKFR